MHESGTLNSAHFHGMVQDTIHGLLHYLIFILRLRKLEHTNAYIKRKIRTYKQLYQAKNKNIYASIREKLSTFWCLNYYKNKNQQPSSNLNFLIKKMRVPDFYRRKSPRN